MRSWRRPFPGRRSSQTGFSLLEVLAAFTILTMMVAVVYGILFVSRKTQRSHEKKLEQYTLIRSGLDRLERDLSMAYLSLNEDQILPDKRTYFKAHNDIGGTTLAFSTFSHVRTSRNAKEADNCAVEYSFMDDPDRAGAFLLRRRETRRLENKPAAEIPGNTLGLIPGVSQLMVEFYDKQNDQWVDEWDSTVDEGRMNKLPDQIKIHLVVDNGTGVPVHFHTMVFPKVKDAINLIPSGTTSGTYMSGSSSTSKSSNSTRTSTSKTTSRVLTPSGRK